MNTGTANRVEASEGTVMKRLAAVSMFALIGLGVLLSSAAPADAWGRGGGWHHGGWRGGGPRVFVGVGPGYWGYPYWYYPPPAYVYAPPVYVQEQPPVYVQQPTAAATAAPSASAPAYWYYCASAREYYPTVQSCPEAWVKVPPRQD